jgi:hypothetical protein
MALETATKNARLSRSVTFLAVADPLESGRDTRSGARTPREASPASDLPRALGDEA